MSSNQQHDRKTITDKIKAIQDGLKKVMNIFNDAKNPDSNNEISTIFKFSDENENFYKDFRTLTTVKSSSVNSDFFNFFSEGTDLFGRKTFGSVLNDTGNDNYQNQLNQISPSLIAPVNTFSLDNLDVILNSVILDNLNDDKPELKWSINNVQNFFMIYIRIILVLYEFETRIEDIYIFLEKSVLEESNKSLKYAKQKALGIFAPLYQGENKFSDLIPCFLYLLQHTRLDKNSTAYEIDNEIKTKDNRATFVDFLKKSFNSYKENYKNILEKSNKIKSEYEILFDEDDINLLDEKYEKLIGNIRAREDEVNRTLNNFPLIYRENLTIIYNPKIIDLKKYVEKSVNVQNAITSDYNDIVNVLKAIEQEEKQKMENERRIEQEKQQMENENKKKMEKMEKTIQMKERRIEQEKHRIEEERKIQQYDDQRKKEKEKFINNILNIYFGKRKSIMIKYRNNVYKLKSGIKKLNIVVAQLNIVFAKYKLQEYGLLNKENEKKFLQDMVDRGYITENRKKQYMQKMGIVENSNKKKVGKYFGIMTPGQIKRYRNTDVNPIKSEKYIPLIDDLIYDFSELPYSGVEYDPYVEGRNKTRFDKKDAEIKKILQEKNQTVGELEAKLKEINATYTKQLNDCETGKRNSIEKINELLKEYGIEIDLNERPDKNENIEKEIKTGWITENYEELVDKIINKDKPRTELQEGMDEKMKKMREARAARASTTRGGRRKKVGKKTRKKKNIKKTRK
jgi:hypothetical protein